MNRTRRFATLALALCLGATVPGLALGAASSTEPTSAAAPASSPNNATAAKGAADAPGTAAKADAPAASTDAPASKDAGTDEQVAAPQVFSADEVEQLNATCVVCHEAPAASFAEDAGAPCLAQSHALVPCVSCHPATDAYAKAHQDATPEAAAKVKKLRGTSVDPQTCLGCHGPAQDLAAATADCTALTDTNGTVVNPHELPEVTDHQKLDCTSCHTMHAANKPADEQALKKCTGCHHARVFECGTCHD